MDVLQMKLSQSSHYALLLLNKDLIVVIIWFTLISVGFNGIPIIIFRGALIVIFRGTLIIIFIGTPIIIFRGTPNIIASKGTLNIVVSEVEEIILLSNFQNCFLVLLLFVVC